MAAGTCEYCSARFWRDEVRTVGDVSRYTKCCRSGRVVLPALPTAPEVVRSLLHGTDARSRNFRLNIRSYNAAFAFTSTYTPDSRNTWDDSERRRRGLWPYMIHGSFYHRSGPLNPEPGSDPQFSQIYFHEPEAATQYRLRNSLTYRGTVLDETILRPLQDYITTNNPYIRTYRSARDQLLSAEAEMRANGLPDTRIRVLLEPNMKITIRTDADLRRENLPTSNEVSMIIPDVVRDRSSWRDIVLGRSTSSGETIRIFDIVRCKHPAYLGLQYVLMLPDGFEGYDIDLVRNGAGERRLTLRDFSRYYLHARERHQTVPFAFGRLFHQWVCDAFANIDQEDLSWIRTHQDDLRSELYSNLTDSISAEDSDIRQVGKRIVLPSSYRGSPRYMAKCFQDSMAIVRHQGRPVMFITMTANPNWPEITVELGVNETAFDRPDLVVRVFHMKLQSLLHDITKLNYFGRCTGCVWTIEYQKRSLPHAHILLFLSPDDRARYHIPSTIDRAIRAELPDAELDPDGSLKAIISKHMVHGPCGEAFRHSPCMTKAVKGSSATICSKNYPKPFSPATIVTEDGYPQYRRRDNGQRVQRTTTIDGYIQTVDLDNRWVVPYSPVLSKKYAAHINVEICCTVKAVKYIHKYIHKGTDRTTVSVESADANVDEVSEYQAGRWISPAEACWHIFGFQSQHQFPPVMALSFHLPDSEVVYRSTASNDDIQKQLQERTTHLDAFFRYNTVNEDGRSTLYPDFPEHFVWVQDRKEWRRRKRQRATIGRLWYASPNSGERFYLRLLLCTVPGATSYEHLRTVNNVLYPSFKDACTALGLLEDDRY